MLLLLLLLLILLFKCSSVDVKICGIMRRQFVVGFTQPVGTLAECLARICEIPPCKVLFRTTTKLIIKLS